MAEENSARKIMQEREINREKSGLEQERGESKE